MRVYVETTLDCSAEQVWDEVQRSALLQEVAGPLVRLLPVDEPAFPERWTEGEVLRCRSYLFGLIPLGTRRLSFDWIDPDAQEIQTRESDPLVRRWDHRIRVRTIDGRTYYSDEIIIDAGLNTFFVWLFAQVFYRHRQRRWRQRVVPRLNAAEPAAECMAS